MKQANLAFSAYSISTPLKVHQTSYPICTGSSFPIITYCHFWGKGYSWVNSYSLQTHLHILLVGCFRAAATECIFIKFDMEGNYQTVLPNSVLGNSTVCSYKFRNDHIHCIQLQESFMKRHRCIQSEVFTGNQLHWYGITAKCDYLTSSIPDDGDRLQNSEVYSTLTWLIAWEGFTFHSVMTECAL
jgi:hypothetical protein